MSERYRLRVIWPDKPALDAGGIPSSVAQNRVDSGQILAREGQLSQCGHVLLDLFHAAGSDQRRGHALIAQHPRQSHLCQRLPALLSQLVQSPNFGELLFIDVALF